MANNKPRSANPNNNNNKKTVSEVEGNPVRNEILLALQRPLILTSIEDVVTRGDLAGTPRRLRVGLAIAWTAWRTTSL